MECIKWEYSILYGNERNNSRPFLKKKKKKKLSSLRIKLTMEIKTCFLITHVPQFSFFLSFHSAHLRQNYINKSIRIRRLCRDKVIVTSVHVFVKESHGNKSDKDYVTLLEAKSRMIQKKGKKNQLFLCAQHLL